MYGCGFANENVRGDEWEEGKMMKGLRASKSVHRRTSLPRNRSDMAPSWECLDCIVKGETFNKPLM